MLTVSRAILIMNKIKACSLLGIPRTRHSISRNVESMSRSTVYRVINRMAGVGLLVFCESDSGENIVTITQIGEELYKSQKRMGLEA